MYHWGNVPDILVSTCLIVLGLGARYGEKTHCQADRPWETGNIGAFVRGLFFEMIAIFHQSPSGGKRFEKIKSLIDGSMMDVKMDDSLITKG